MAGFQVTTEEAQARIDRAVVIEKVLAPQKRRFRHRLREEVDLTMSPGGHAAQDKKPTDEVNKEASVTRLWSRHLLSGTLVVCSVLVALMMAEVMVRLLSPQGMFVPWQDELNGVLALRPHVRGRFAIPDTFDKTISSNSQRFRGLREYSQKPETGVARIATLGDSLTFGYGANDDETYPAQLERHLMKSLLSGARQAKVEVINASDPGTGTGDQALFFATWVARFQPDLVILNVHENDVDDDHERRMFVVDGKGNAAPRPQKELVSADAPLRKFRRLLNELPAYSILAQHSQLLSFLKNVVAQVVLRTRASAFQDDTQVSANSSREIFIREGIPMMVAEIQWLNAQVRESRSRLIVTFLPPPWWEDKAPYEMSWKSDLIVRALADLSTRDGIPFIDVTPLVRAREVDLGKSLFYQGRDVHPNPMGYEAFAEIISQYILSQHLIPSDTRARAVGK